MGYKSVILPYQPPDAAGGKIQIFAARRCCVWLADAIFSFSLVPLYIGISLGILFLVLALLEMIYVLSFWVTGNHARARLEFADVRAAAGRRHPMICWGLLACTWAIFSRKSKAARFTWCGARSHLPRKNNPLTTNLPMRRLINRP